MYSTEYPEKVRIKKYSNSKWFYFSFTITTASEVSIIFIILLQILLGWTAISIGSQIKTYFKYTLIRYLIIVSMHP